jgi:CDGSH-type Zn-finger protein
MAGSGAASGMTITIGKDGPYRVSGGVPLSQETIGVNAAEESIAWVDGPDLTPGGAYFLCRCGQSANKPFCDGSHARVGFDGAETASRAPYVEQADSLAGPTLTLRDAEALCGFARFCDRAGKVWNTVSQAASPEQREAFTFQVGQCPSGRLVAVDGASGQAIEPDLPASIVLVEDPQEGVAGPLWVRGGIEIIGLDGTAWEVRNRVTLCRCGASNNKPFCDGSHASEAFKDG